MWTLVPGYHQELFAFIPGSADSSMSGGLIASQCLSSLFFLAYQFRPFTTLRFSSLSFFFQAYEIVDIKSFGVFLLPLLGIDLYALYAGLKKCRSE